MTKQQENNLILSLLTLLAALIVMSVVSGVSKNAHAVIDKTWGRYCQVYPQGGAFIDNPQKDEIYFISKDNVCIYQTRQQMKEALCGN